MDMRQLFTAESNQMLFPNNPSHCVSKFFGLNAIYDRRHESVMSLRPSYMI